jgi:hypothetical protein
MFVFFADFKILPKDSMGRAWYIPTYSELKKHYMLYSKKFFSIECGELIQVFIHIVYELYAMQYLYIVPKKDKVYLI